MLGTHLWYDALCPVNSGLPEVWDVKVSPACYNIVPRQMCCGWGPVLYQVLLQIHKYNMYLVPSMIRIFNTFLF